MPAIKWGQDLVKRLKESGTPDEPLAVARAIIEDAWSQRQEHATADDVAKAIEAAVGGGIVSEGTAIKARALADTGALPVTEVIKPIEERIPPPPDDTKPKATGK